MAPSSPLYNMTRMSSRQASLEYMASRMTSLHYGCRQTPCPLATIGWPMSAWLSLQEITLLAVQHSCCMALSVTRE